MRYSISYECRTEGKVFVGAFQIDSPDLPEPTDPKVIELARKDSIRFFRAGLAGITIIDISER